MVTAVERSQARETLGIPLRSVDRASLETMDHESLVDLILLERQRHKDRIAERVAGIEALHKRLETARKARRLANRRADAAVRVSKDLLETLSKEIKIG